MKPLRVHHVSINVSDVEASTAFYTKVLGGTIRDDRPTMRVEGAWIDLGDTQLHLIGREVPPNVGQHFAVLVDDIGAAVVELRDVGVAVGDPVAIGTGRQAFLQDPDGNLIELHETASAG